MAQLRTIGFVLALGLSIFARAQYIDTDHIPHSPTIPFEQAQRIANDLLRRLGCLDRVDPRHCVAQEFSHGTHWWILTNNSGWQVMLRGSDGKPYGVFNNALQVKYRNGKHYSRPKSRFDDEVARKSRVREILNSLELVGETTSLSFIDPVLSQSGYHAFTADVQIGNGGEDTLSLQFVHETGEFSCASWSYASDPVRDKSRHSEQVRNIPPTKSKPASKKSHSKKRKRKH